MFIGIVRCENAVCFFSLFSQFPIIQMRSEQEKSFLFLNSSLSPQSPSGLCVQWMELIEREKSIQLNRFYVKNLSNLNFSKKEKNLHQIDAFSKCSSAIDACNFEWIEKLIIMKNKKWNWFKVNKKTNQMFRLLNGFLMNLIGRCLFHFENFKRKKNCFPTTKWSLFCHFVLRTKPNHPLWFWRETRALIAFYFIDRLITIASSLFACKKSVCIVRHSWLIDLPNINWLLFFSFSKQLPRALYVSLNWFPK